MPPSADNPGSASSSDGPQTFSAEDLSGREIAGCRIPHAPAQEVHRRQGPRLHLNQAVRLRCFTGLPPGKVRIRLVDLEKRPAAEWDAILLEAGAGGCSIEISAGQCWFYWTTALCHN